MTKNADYERRDFLVYVGMLGAGIAALRPIKILGFNPLETTVAEAAPQTSTKPKITKSEVEEILDGMMKKVFKIYNDPETKEKMRDPFYKLIEMRGYQIVNG